MLRTACYTYILVMWELFPLHWCWAPGLPTPRWRHYVPLQHNESISLLSVTTHKSSGLYLYIFISVALSSINAFSVHKFLCKKQGIGNTNLCDLKVQSVSISNLLAVAPTDTAHTFTGPITVALTFVYIRRVAAIFTRITWACQHQTSIALSKFSFCWSTVMVFI